MNPYLSTLYIAALRSNKGFVDTAISSPVCPRVQRHDDDADADDDEAPPGVQNNWLYFTGSHVIGSCSGVVDDEVGAKTACAAISLQHLAALNLHGQQGDHIPYGMIDFVSPRRGLESDRLSVSWTESTVVHGGRVVRGTLNEAHKTKLQTRVLLVARPHEASGARTFGLPITEVTRLACLKNDASGELDVTVLPREVLSRALNLVTWWLTVVADHLAFQIRSVHGRQKFSPKKAINRATGFANTFMSAMFGFCVPDTVAEKGGLYVILTKTSANQLERNRKVNVVYDNKTSTAKTLDNVTDTDAYVGMASCQIWDACTMLGGCKQLYSELEVVKAIGDLSGYARRTLTVTTSPGATSETVSILQYSPHVPEQPADVISDSLLALIQNAELQLKALRAPLVEPPGHSFSGSAFAPRAGSVRGHSRRASIEIPPPENVISLDSPAPIYSGSSSGSSGSSGEIRDVVYVTTVPSRDQGLYRYTDPSNVHAWTDRTILPPTELQVTYFQGAIGNVVPELGSIGASVSVHTVLGPQSEAAPMYPPGYDIKAAVSSLKPLATEMSSKLLSNGFSNCSISAVLMAFHGSLSMRRVMANLGMRSGAPTGGMMDDLIRPLYVISSMNTTQTITNTTTPISHLGGAAKFALQSRGNLLASTEVVNLLVWTLNHYKVKGASNIVLCNPVPPESVSIPDIPLARKQAMRITLGVPGDKPIIPGFGAACYVNGELALFGTFTSENCVIVNIGGPTARYGGWKSPRTKRTRRFDLTLPIYLDGTATHVTGYMTLVAVVTHNGSHYKSFVRIDEELWVNMDTLHREGQRRTCRTSDIVGTYHDEVVTAVYDNYIDVKSVRETASIDGSEMELLPLISWIQGSMRRSNADYNVGDDAYISISRWHLTIDQFEKAEVDITCSFTNPDGSKLSVTVPGRACVGIQCFRFNPISAYLLAGGNFDGVGNSPTKPFRVFTADVVVRVPHGSTFLTAAAKFDGMRIYKWLTMEMEVIPDRPAHSAPSRPPIHPQSRVTHPTGFRPDEL